MLNKDEYWENRRKGHPGQGKQIKPKFYPKGQSVTYFKDDEELEYPNALGTRGLNRKQRRYNGIR